MTSKPIFDAFCAANAVRPSEGILCAAIIYIPPFASDDPAAKGDHRFVAVTELEAMDAFIFSAVFNFAPGEQEALTARLPLIREAHRLWNLGV